MATCKDCIHYDVCKDTWSDDHWTETTPEEIKEMFSPKGCETYKPTADVQEVKRGYDTKKCRIFECSVCGYGVNDIFQSNESDYPVGNFNYCPNCGAKMDLKEPTYCEDKKNHLCHCEDCHERECEK